MFIKKVAVPLAAISIGCLLGLLIAELALRYLWSGNQRYYLWAPNYTATLNLEPGVMPGVGKVAHIRINSEGIRGSEWSSERSREYRILAVGGSTTECLNLDQDKTWPALLQDGLRGVASGRHIWVGNLGKAGLNTRDHLGLMRLAIGQFDVDLIIMLIGGNDMIHRLMQHSSYDPFFTTDEQRYLDWLGSRFAIVPLDREPSFVQRLALRRLVKRTIRVSQSIQRDHEGTWIVRLREVRKRASLVNDLPPLDSGLDEYKRNIQAIVSEARRRALRMVLVTQPTIWKQDMSDHEQSLLWMGWRPDGRFYTTEALAKAMASYNDRLLETCSELTLDCIDLASRVPPTTELFYDDMHFTEAGARRIANELIAYFREGGLLNGGNKAQNSEPRAVTLAPAATRLGL
jgi:lysophospholipase L1-like esterase